MKKIIPIISLISAGAIFAGFNYGSTTNEAKIKGESLDNSLAYFQENVENFNSIKNNKSYTTTAFGKYELALAVPNGATLVSAENELDNDENELGTASDSGISTLELDNDDTETTDPETVEDDDNEDLDELETEDENGDISIDDSEKISTLYSLSGDIEEECEDFVLLKESIINSITETRNLIEKVNSNEIELTDEQKLFIIKQSNQLKALGKELSKTTCELNLYLSDLSSIFKDEGGNLDDLSVKYLLVLDNLVNGNEMLENGLSRIRLMNSIFNMNNSLAPNNTGRIVYGFRQNNDPPIIKDYIINEDGTLTENNNESTENTTETLDSESNENINTLSSNDISNIDTYNYGTSNIDTFFNTALFDNEFMFGRNGYGYGGLGMYGNGYGFNAYNGDRMNQAPYVNENYSTQPNSGFQGRETNTTNNSVDNEYNTPNNETLEKGGFKFKKNIDTYRSENSPSLNTRFKNLKQNVSSFFSKFSKPHKAENPVYRFDEEDNKQN